MNRKLFKLISSGIFLGGTIMILVNGCGDSSVADREFSGTLTKAGADVMAMAAAAGVSGVEVCALDGCDTTDGAGIFVIPVSNATTGGVEFTFNGGGLNTKLTVPAVSGTGDVEFSFSASGGKVTGAVVKKPTTATATPTKAPTTVTPTPTKAVTPGSTPTVIVDPTPTSTPSTPGVTPTPTPTTPAVTPTPTPSTPGVTPTPTPGPMTCKQCIDGCTGKGYGLSMCQGICNDGYADQVPKGTCKCTAAGTDDKGAACTAANWH